MEGSYERVHSMPGYYDGPVLGVADFEGQPHVYYRIDELDDPTFALKPIPAALMPLVLEDWQIWLRWQAAFNAGRTPKETHPSLPEDRARDKELETALEALYRVDPVGALRAHATFRAVVPGHYWPNGGALEVQWRRAADPHVSS